MEPFHFKAISLLLALLCQTCIFLEVIFGILLKFQGIQRKVIYIFNKQAENRFGQESAFKYFICVTVSKSILFSPCMYLHIRILLNLLEGRQVFWEL